MYSTSRALKRVLFLSLLILLAACTKFSPPKINEGSYGLTASYFGNNDFTGPKVSQIDRYIYFNWGQIAPARGLFPGNFSASWQADFVVTTPDTYQFFIETTGKATLKINGRTLSHGESLRLEPHQGYTFELSFVKTSPDASLKLEWSGKTFKRTLIPQEHFRSQTRTSELNTLVTTNTNLLLNSDFEGGTGGWLQFGGSFSAATPGRNDAGSAVQAGGWAWIQQNLPISDIEPGQVYTLTGYARSTSGTCTIGMAGGTTSGQSFSKVLSYRSNFFLGQVISMTLPQNPAWLAVYLASGQESCDFDDLSLKAGTATPPVLPNPSNLVLNGNFEEGLTNWGRFGGLSNLVNPGQDGTGSALKASSWAWIQQDMPGSLFEVSESYIISARVKSSTSSICKLGFVGASPTNTLFSVSLEFNNSTWEHKTLSQSIPLGLSWAAIYLASGQSGCSFDDISVVLDNPDSVLDSELQTLLVRNGLAPLNLGPQPNANKVALGRLLMHDKELSGNRDISCATCHSANLSTTDQISLSIGVSGQGLGHDRILAPDTNYISRNAPDLFNRGAPQWHTMFWDGRVSGTPKNGFTTRAGDQLPAGLDSVLAAQAMMVVTSRLEMRGQAGDNDIFGSPNELAIIEDANNTAIWNALMNRLKTIDAYRPFFAAAYPDVPESQLGFQHAANAIAAFESSAFSSTNSPFDRYLNGERKAMNTAAKRGAVVFYRDANCVICHSGTLMTNQGFHNIGVPQIGPGFGPATPLDYGRFAITGIATDKFAFRTPPLRNVALTGPWMHDGAFTNLEEVIRHYDNVPASLAAFTGNNLRA